MECQTSSLSLREFRRIRMPAKNLGPNPPAASGKRRRKELRSFDHVRGVKGNERGAEDRLRRKSKRLARACPIDRGPLYTPTGTDSSFGRYCSAMPTLKYFLCVGPLLSILLFGWSEYLEPSGTRISVVLQPANTVEAFRPTPAPPIVESESPLSLESLPPSEIQKSTKPSKIARAHPRKAKTKVASERERPRDSFAYKPAESFFLSWR
jgi:hypothetical protein